MWDCKGSLIQDHVYIFSDNINDIDDIFYELEEQRYASNVKTALVQFSFDSNNPDDLLCIEFNYNYMLWNCYIIGGFYNCKEETNKYGTLDLSIMSKMVDIFKFNDPRLSIKTL